MSDSSPNEQQLIEALQLNLVSGIGPRIQQALCDCFGSPGEVLAAGDEQLQQVAGVGPKLAQAILANRDLEKAQHELTRCRDAGINLVLRGTDDYPRMLAEICDPPNVLYCRGNLEPPDELTIAIVGSRRCTLYGRQQAERLAGTLARAGMTVASGLARGIDAAAHRGALAVGGRTIAVMASGLAGIYPPEHAELAEEVVASGVMMSESPLEQKPVAGLFPQRNRVISGLSLGVILVEASRRSGALHTARHAMEQGREVFAVPGRIDSLASEGCHNLIRDGVTLIRHADDVLEALGPLMQPVRRSADEEVHSPRELTLTDQQREILNHVTTEPLLIDEVLRHSGLEPSRVLATLTILEMKRMVRRLPGGYLVRIAN